VLHPAGTRITAPTESVRLLLYFPKELLPYKLEIIIILINGKVVNGLCRKELVIEKNLWIIEFDNPPLNSGAFAYWIWPHINSEKKLE
jgi:hypothetical protein